MKSIVYVCCLFVLFVGNVNAQVKITQKNIWTVDTKALTIDGKFGTAINGRTYQKDVFASYKGYQYIAYYNEHTFFKLNNKHILRKKN